MQDILIAHDPVEESQSYPPVVLLRSEHEDRGVTWDNVAQISISHDGDYATATCLAYDPVAQERLDEAMGTNERKK